MRKVLLRWATSAVPVLFLVTAVVFVLTSLIPGDAGRSILGANATEQQVAALDQQLGLDQPLAVRYWHWLFAALHGDLGRSITTGVPVIDEIRSRAGVTAALIGGAVLVSALVGVLLGFVSALRGGWVGRIVDVASILGMAVPNFWLALVLISLFAVELRIFPATGYTPFGDSPGGWAASLFLPVIVLAMPAAAPIAKQTRDGVLNQVDREYVRVLRARGIPERSVLLRHVLRNAAAPILTVVGIVTIVLLGGTALVESAFVLPGLGGLVVNAAMSQDIATVQGVAVVFTVYVLVINLITECLYLAIDPKIRT